MAGIVVEGNPKQLNKSGLHALTLPPETMISLAFSNAISLKSRKQEKQTKEKKKKLLRKSLLSKASIS